MSFFGPTLWDERERGHFFDARNRARVAQKVGLGDEK
jgi:hypothetical protein